MSVRWPAAPRWRPPAVLVDATVAIAVAVVVCAAIAVASESRSIPPDAVAYALACVLALLTLGRRHRPLGVLLGSWLVLLAYYVLQYPGISPALALAVPLYAAAVAGRAGWSLAVVGFFVLAGMLVRALGEGEELLALVVDTLREASMMVVVVLLGATVRARRLRAEADARALAAADAQRERDAARRVAEERLRIARELHDVLAHTITAVTVHAGVAIDLLEDSPVQAREALREVRGATRAAMEELRATVGMLRDGDGPDAPLVPMPTLHELDGLVSTARRQGLHVGLERLGEIRPLPAAVELTAYRIVQESLTNVVRHSGAAGASVVLRYHPGGLDVEVTDDGPGPPPGAGDQAGHGIDGMRERAAALGGSLQAGRPEGGGFEVRARLPVERPGTGMIRP